jgi:hypothetical protein
MSDMSYDDAAYNKIMTGHGISNEDAQRRIRQPITGDMHANDAFEDFCKFCILIAAFIAVILIVVSMPFWL